MAARDIDELLGYLRQWHKVICDAGAPEAKSFARWIAAVEEQKKMIEKLQSYKARHLCECEPRCADGD